MRFGIYHLLIAANDADPTVNIGAKSLSGEGYRGHVFWDTEILMLPFFIFTQPRRGAQPAAYRHHTLPGARANARESTAPAGPATPWESADTGREECPEFTADGANRFWTREEEVHVSADVALRDHAVRRGHRRHRLPARVRRRDPVRDQPVLGRPGRVVGAGPCSLTR